MLHTDIGQCIYCGETNPPLTREHVLPRGLGGFRAPTGYHEALVLRRASCGPCQQITQQIEHECLTQMLWPIRSRLKFDRKDRRPSHVPIQLLLADGSTITRNVEPELAHAPIVVTHFDKAEVLGKRSYSPRTTVVFPPQFHVSARQHGAKGIGLSARENRPRFAQMLAKIGLGLAVAQFGLKGFHPLVREFIRFLPNDYRHWVGGRKRKDDSRSKNLHSLMLTVENTPSGAFVIAEIQLFASYGAPVNYVIVGKPLVPDQYRKMPHV
jgi:hypothetical protein